MSEEIKLRRLDSLPVKRNITGNEYFVGIDATDILMHIADVKNYFGVSSATSMLGIATPTSMPVAGDGFYIALEAGTYVNFGGLVVNESSLAVIFAKSGVFTITQTSIGGGYLTDSDINVPGGVTGFEPIGKVEEGDKRAVSGEEVLLKTVSSNSQRLLPDGINIYFFDRPDLDDKHYIIDKNNNIVDRFLTENKEAERLLPESTSMYFIDRPDLPLFLMSDKNNNFLIENTHNKGGAEFTKLPFWNPINVAGAFSVPVAGNDTIVSNYNALITEYDSLMNTYNLSGYISKSIIGYSSVDNIPIYKYNFKPKNAQLKILLYAGTHANEKMYVWVLRYFMGEILKNWSTAPFLEYLRWNVEIDVLPCRSPYTLSNSVRKRGFRIIPETTQIPFTWNKLGNTITLIFNESDFPDNDLLKGNNYFTAVAASQLINKTSFGIITSSDIVALPLNTYRIESIISNKSITFKTPNTDGGNSGNGTFQVWADPNRNVSINGTTNWEDWVGTNSIQPSDTGKSVGFHDAKGTRPFSLQENRALFNIISNDKYDYTLDMHAPASDNYLDFDSTNGFTFDTDEMVSKSKTFGSTVSSITDVKNSQTPYPIIAMTRDYSTNSQLIEWGSGLYDATANQANDAMRWMTIVLNEAIYKLNKK